MATTLRASAACLLVLLTLLSTPASATNYGGQWSWQWSQSQQQQCCPCQPCYRTDHRSDQGPVDARQRSRQGYDQNQGYDHHHQNRWQTQEPDLDWRTGQQNRWSAQNGYDPYLPGQFGPSSIGQSGGGFSGQAGTAQQAKTPEDKLKALGITPGG